MTTNDNNRIINLALAARTVDQASAVQDLIAARVGQRHQRPIGDRWNNQGILTGSGSSFDYKALEVVTNMQDAVLELLAIQKFGTRDAVPFATPHEAASALLSDKTRKTRAALASVAIDRAGAQSEKKCITLVMRDRGCGITPIGVPQSIFMIGSNHKDGCDWQQGTFGLGGATTYRNAEAVVLVTRRHPDLLKPGEADAITVAVVEWERIRTTINAFYLVTEEWSATNGAAALPFSVPASGFSEFEPGTHLALISYATAGLGRRSGDERSFDTVLNTRLYQPVLPVRYRNNITRPDRDETLDGLERRLDSNRGEEGTEGNDTLPFNHDGTTYQLPIRFRLFAKPGTKGQRRNFVAHGHALLITSNGQVHSHWSPQDFKSRTKLNKLYDRALIVVESDALPIEVRTDLFTADRAQLVRSAAAMRLESEIAAFLNEWPALSDANKTLIREAVTGDNNDRPTIAIAEKIARALNVRGFSIGGAGVGKTGGRGPMPPNPTPAEDLYDNPTHFEGPDAIECAIGKVKGVHFKLNATDGFLGANQRAPLKITCDHPDIGADEITVGELRSGRVRVSVAVPENADLGTFELNAEIPAWVKTSGGLGPRFAWTTKIEFVKEITRKEPGVTSGKDAGKHGSGEGGLVAIVWKSDDDGTMDEWSAATVGEIQMVNGAELARVRDEYKDLAKIDAEIPTIILNLTYSPLKAYVQARSAELTDEGKEQVRDRYAVGVGVALCLLDQEARKAEEKTGKALDGASLAAGRRAAARAVLSVMPDYDRLAKELDA